MKVYLFVICLLLACYSFGQRHNITINYKPALTYFGKQSQNFHDHYFISRKGDQTFNNSVNILYTYKISAKVNFSTGLEYSQQGQNINFNADSVFPSADGRILKTELNYFRIPCTINYTIFKMKNVELNIYSGVSFGIATKQVDNYSDILIQTEYIDLPPFIKRYKNVDWAIPIGTTYKKELTKKIFANFGIEYLVGLTNAFSSHSFSKYGVLSEFNNSRQSRLSLNIGIGFNLSK